MVTTDRELIPEQRFFQVAGAMITVASAFVLLRIGAQIWRRKPMRPQDYLIYFAYICFLSMSICYLVIIPTVYRIGGVRSGLTKPWPAFAKDLLTYIRLMFVTTSLFWLSVWSVKFSLLALYKILMDGLPIIYIRLWWATFIFCLIVSTAQSYRPFND